MAGVAGIASESRHHQGVLIMTPEQIDRVFGRERLKMATGEHVEVFREAAAWGERRRYTKRFLSTAEGDYGQWTEREWRILARLIGHGIRSVPDVVQFDRGTMGGTQQVQTYDAGATVDQWATILPVSRQGRVHRHVFEDCAHWWALAHHCLLALQEIHALHVVHLDIKGDNVCIPVGPAEFDPDTVGLLFYPRFDQLALIDFAFALVSRERLTTALPLGWETEYDYQSPRLLSALEAGRRGDLQPTRELDWRCDMYSLAAMLKRYLPEEDVVHDPKRATGWSAQRYRAAKSFILAVREAHDRDAPQQHPHPQLIEMTRERLSAADLAASLQHGWTLARDASLVPVAASPLTPVTRLAPPVHMIVSPRDLSPGAAMPGAHAPTRHPPQRNQRARLATIAAALIAVIGAGVGLPLVPKMVESLPMLADAGRAALEFIRNPVSASSDQASQSEDALPSAQRVAAAKPEKVEPGEPNKDSIAPPKEASEDSSKVSTPAEAAKTPSDAAVSQPAAAERVTSEQSAARPNAPAQETRPAEQTSIAAAAPSTPAPSTVQSRSAVASSRAAPSRTTRSASQAPRTPPIPSVKKATSSSTAKGAATSLSAARLATDSLIDAQRIRAVSPGTSDGVVTHPAPATAAIVASPDPVEPAAAGVAAERTAANAATSEARSVAAAQESRREEPAPQSVPRPAQPTPATQPARRSEARPAPATGLEGLLTKLFNLTRGDGKKAPTEERTLRTPPSPSSLPRPPARIAQNDASRAAATPRSDAVPTAVLPVEGARPETARAPATMPLGSYAPQTHASAESATRLPDTESPATVDSPVQPLAWEQVSSAARLPSVGPGPDAANAGQADFTAQAKRMLAQSVPRTAVQAEPEVSRVLMVAARSQRSAQEHDIVAAVRRTWPSGVVPPALGNDSPAVARQLNDQARQAFLTHRDPVEAFDLQLRAFGANPRDAEVAGNLAFLYLKLSPPQPEIARQVVLHAMALNSVQLHTTRADDWLTFAVANALIGRQDDATNALYVSIALTQDLERSCKAALGAMAGYGERLKQPVQAMMLRIHSQGRDYESPFCSWPPRGNIARTYF
jgi:hypothetical protein